MSRHLAESPPRARAHHLGSFHGTAGPVRQRTALKLRQREILTALGAPEPASLVAVDPA